MSRPAGTHRPYINTVSYEVILIRYILWMYCTTEVINQGGGVVPAFRGSSGFPRTFQLSGHSSFPVIPAFRSFQLSGHSKLSGSSS
jgi:hypothetical protein